MSNQESFEIWYKEFDFDGSLSDKELSRAAWQAASSTKSDVERRTQCRSCGSEDPKTRYALSDESGFCDGPFHEDVERELQITRRALEMACSMNPVTLLARAEAAIAKAESEGL
jgi:hypothetical protein